MDPTRPKAIWGFNGTERPGAVYLAAALAAHSQKGIPAFSIYGHDVQDADDTSIPADVEEKLLRFARAGLAVASMKGKSYLSLGGVSMGIAGSIVDHNFFESWLGMKVQAVDMTELRRRIDQKIYDEAELEMALAWADKNFRYGEDENNKQYQRNAEQSRAVLRESLLMAMCIRDMMQGNSKLADIGRVEESPVSYTHLSILRNARALHVGEAPNMVVCWGGHSINENEYLYARRVGNQLGQMCIRDSHSGSPCNNTTLMRSMRPDFGISPGRWNPLHGNENKNKKGRVKTKK